MKREFYIYLKLKPYVRQWLVNAYGEPVRFGAHSLENAELRRWLIPVPDGCLPLLPIEGSTAVVIPQSNKKAETYNYLTKEARECVISMINNNFDFDLKHSICKSLKNGSSKKAALRAWMREHGIDIDYEDTMMKRIDRMIAYYKRKKINVFSFDKRYDKRVLKK